MIFVTVGTHEQPFNRLVKCIDDLKTSGKITEDVFIQTGFSTYVPVSCKWASLLRYDEMEDMISKAHIVITHGGPASFLAPIKDGKVPIVVPRMKQFKEHVNDHQVDFTRAVSEWQKNIILVEDISQLAETIANYDETAARMAPALNSNNTTFVQGLERVTAELFGDE